MRILHLSSLYAPHAVGGAERVVQCLAEGMAAAGETVAVAHLVPEPVPAGTLNGVQLRPLAHRNPLWIERVAGYPTPLRNLNKIATLFNPLTRHDLARLVDEFRPDIVHSHSMVDLPPHMWKIAKQQGAALVHTLHDYDLLCIRAALFKDGERCLKRHHACAAFSLVKKRFHGHIDRVVGVSAAILDTHLEHGLFAALPTQARHVVWNPVAEVRGVRRRERRSGPLTFGFLGRLVPEKGILTLLQACRQLGSGDWQLKIGGRAPADVQPLVDLASGLPVVFAGYVDPAAFLATIDVLVVPSIWLEPFGLTIVEAYAAGVRVIGADVAGVAEIVGAVDPQALVRANDAGALAARMAQWLAMDRQAATALPEVAPVLERTRPGHVVGAYLDIYRAALADRTEPARTPLSSPCGSATLLDPRRGAGWAQPGPGGS